ncbi:MAG: FKBP-type peptidyl-prolyl cis-trans isomerase [Woeseia sp.]
MNLGKSTAILASLTLLAACDKPAPNTTEQAAAPAAAETATDTDPVLTEIAPGLSMRILRDGDGDIAETGQIAVVHYTGWLYDESAQDNRGDKFDSSVDRDQYFSFMVGAKRVIRGWDEGVVGMKVGELRELTIAPEMAYGDRGAGDVIPPGATLVFEIELAALEAAE